MAILTASLTDSIKSAIGGGVIAKKATAEKSTSFLKISAKNFLSISGFARDLNVAKRNIEQLVELMGGKPVKGDKVDAHFLKEDEREKKLEVERAKGREEGKAEQVKPKKKGKGLFDKLKDKFSANKILKSIGKYLVIGAIVTTIFVAFKDTFVEWTKSLWEAIKESFDGFVEKIKEWFNDIVQPILDGIKEFIQPMIDAVSEMFKKIGDFFVETFGKIKEFFEPVMEFVSKIWNKFTGMIDEFKNWLKPKVESAMNIGFGGAIPQFLKTWLGIGVKKEPEKVDDSAERKKLERQQKEALDTKRVREQEKKAQYTGEDKIVRKRHGIEDKTMTMRAEEAKKKETPVAAAPSTTPTPSKEKKEEKPLEVSGIQATIVESLKQSGIESPKAHANVLATVKAESNFKVQSENLNYSSPERIQAVFGKRRIPTVEFAEQFVKNPEALANHVYKTTDGNSAEGDGFKYRGRGFIQHTGKNQYAAIAKFTGADVLKNPDALNSPEVAAKAIPWFLLSYKKMKPEDVENMSKVNKAIAFADPTGKKAMEREASAQQIYASMSGGSGTQVASASSEVASGQRQQQKPQTPVIVNAPTTNTTVVKNTQVASAPQKNTAGMLVSRAA
jgi:putative chitinase